MNKNIKEILDNLSDESYYSNFITSQYGGPDYYYLLEKDEGKLLLDYITNLQEKINQYENPDDMTLFYMWLDEKSKDKMKKLQEENKKLKEDNYELQKYINEEEGFVKDENRELGLKIDKTNDILKDTNVDMPATLLIETIDYARHILNGGDDNVK